MAEKDKLLVLSYVNKLQTPILKDQTIFILTFLVGKWEQSKLPFHVWLSEWRNEIEKFWEFFHIHGNVPYVKQVFL